MSNPFFSIVTPVFNGETHIEETIKSVLSQSIDDYEYTIVDNMSTDNTRNIINKYSSNITKIISEKDDGMYDALNKGFASSRGKYFLWLNSDDFLKNKDVLKKVKNYLEKNPHARWIIGNTSFKYEKFDFSLTFFNTSLFFKKSSEFNQRKYLPLDDAKPLFKASYIPSSFSDIIFVILEEYLLIIFLVLSVDMLSTIVYS